MDFVGETAIWQRNAAECPEGVVRRQKVFEALAMTKGQAVLDIGCGGGQLLRELAVCVGEKGRAVGIDLSEDQLNAARSYCASLPSVELVQSSAATLPFDDGIFDGLSSIQVLEYIQDLNSVLEECRRVLKHGGKAAFISVMWDHWRFHGADPKLNDRIMEAFRAHCPYQSLPVDLPMRLIKAGFGGINQSPIAFFNGSLHENTLAFWASKLAAAFVISQGIDKVDAELWLDQLTQASKKGNFGFVYVPILTQATAI
jgi:SAM-dependent methyltransferase